MPTASSPVTSDVGLSQLPTRSPAAMPGGTRPLAMAPATVPRKNGVSREEKANVAPNNRCRDTSVLTLRNANVAPRAAPLGATGEQVPDPATEVGPAEQHVGGQAKPRDGQHDLG